MCPLDQLFITQAFDWRRLNLHTGSHNYTECKVLYVSINSSVQTHKYGHILLCLTVIEQCDAQFQRQEHGRFKPVQYKHPSKRVHASLTVRGINTELHELFIFSTNQYRTDCSACTGELLALEFRWQKRLPALTQCLSPNTERRQSQFTDLGHTCKWLDAFRPTNAVLFHDTLRPQTPVTVYYGWAREKGGEGGGYLYSVTCLASYQNNRCYGGSSIFSTLLFQPGCKEQSHR